MTLCCARPAAAARRCLRPRQSGSTIQEAHTARRVRRCGSRLPSAVLRPRPPRLPSRSLAVMTLSTSMQRCLRPCRHAGFALAARSRPSRQRSPAASMLFLSHALSAQARSTAAPQALARSTGTVCGWCLRACRTLWKRTTTFSLRRPNCRPCGARCRAIRSKQPTGYLRRSADGCARLCCHVRRLDRCRPA